uniref:methyl-accepting chemotaxis protein n=2 Tax=Ralstonia solanacearum TaxID=305 RepID=UPI00066E72C2
MGFKWFNAGRRAGGEAGAPEVAAEGAGVAAVQLENAQLDEIDPAGPPSQLSHGPIDTVVGWMGRVPFVAQQRVFTVGLLIGLVALLASIYFDNRQANNGSLQIEIAGDTLMHSQRLAKAVPVALLGNENAFNQLKESRARLQSNLEALKTGAADRGLSATAGGEAKALLDKSIEEWKRSEKSAQAVLAQEKTLVAVGKTLNVFNASNPELLEEAEQISSMKLQTNAPAREVAASSQLVMLTQRLGKNMNEFLAGEGVNPETAFLLGKDTNTFRETLNGLLNGSDALRLTAAADPETKGYLQELSTRFDNVQKTTQIILENLPGLIAAKRAQQQIFNDNEKLRADLSDLQSAYSGSVRSRPLTLGAVVLSAILTVACLAGLAALYLRDSRVRAMEAEARQREAEERRMVEKRNNDATQAAILRLMNELQDIADGDLTKQATVSEDITGAIADSVNYTVEELRELVGRVQQTAEQVTQASSAVQTTSDKLVLASEEQSRQIRQTGQSVVEMADRITQVSRGAAESANVARASLAAAEQGQQAVQNAITGMNDIRDQIQDTSKRIKRLGESSQEIGEIVVHDSQAGFCSL